MRVAIVEFPGSYGAEDARYAYEKILGAETQMVSCHQEYLRDVDLLVIPAGAAFGDVYRPGALAKTCAIAGSIRRFARTGRVLGIGNGFQILCELGLLKGILLRNDEDRFYRGEVFVKFEGGNSFLATNLKANEVLKLPVACGYGAYYVDRRSLAEIEENSQVALRYANEFGEVKEEEPFLGSLKNIAALASGDGNVVGMMVHPERAIEEFIGSEAGRKILEASITPSSSSASSQESASI
jgi:phosphoribosylformylglycinamidine synthase subunit PurQ / glutaminase